MPRIRPLPDGRLETFRIANVGVRGALVECPVCLRKLYVVFDLWNQERRECCGHQFTLEVVRVDAVTYKMPPDPSKEYLSKMTPFESSPK